MRRSLSPARRIAMAVIAVLTFSAQAALAEQSCPGRSIIGDLKTRSPELHARVTDAAATTSNAGHVLWRIEREGRAASHLLGTIHLTDPRVNVLSEELRSALDRAGTVALEVADLSPEAMAGAMAKSGDLVTFADGRNLATLLSPEEIAGVEQILVGAGLPAEAAPVFKPWVVSLMLAVSECERRKVQSGKLVLDARIASLARDAGKNVVGLETIDSQLAAMASLPDAAQLDMLRAGLKYVDRIDDNMETLLQLYLDRQLGMAWPLQIALAEKVGIGREAFAEFEQRLVIDRNLRMVEAARPLLDKGNVLVAVGALHLPGERGLVALLRKAGYTLTPIE